MFLILLLYKKKSTNVFNFDALKKTYCFIKKSQQMFLILMLFKKTNCFIKK